MHGSTGSATYLAGSTYSTYVSAGVGGEGGRETRDREACPLHAQCLC